MCVHRQDRVRAGDELEECYCGPGKFTGGLEQVLAWLRERRPLFCAPGSARLSPALGTIGPGRRADDGTERPAPRGESTDRGREVPSVGQSPCPLVSVSLAPFFSGSAPQEGEPGSVPALQGFGEPGGAQDGLNAHRAAARPDRCAQQPWLWRPTPFS